MFDAIEDAPGQLGLQHERKLDLAVGGNEERGIGVGVEPGVGARDVVGDDQIDLLRREFLSRAWTRVARLRGKADKNR